jgi:hypothetical protein
LDRERRDPAFGWIPHVVDRAPPFDRLERRRVFILPARRSITAPIHHVPIEPLVRSVVRSAAFWYRSCA